MTSRSAFWKGAPVGQRTPPSAIAERIASQAARLVCHVRPSSGLRAAVNRSTSRALPIGLRFAYPGQGFLGDLEAELEGAFDGDPPVAEVLVGEDLHLLVLRVLGVVGDVQRLRVQAGDLADLVVGEELALVAEGLAHLGELVAGVEQDHLAGVVGRLAVGQDPEVRGDAGVVEELVGQGDDALQPVVLQDPPADASTRPSRPRR